MAGGYDIALWVLLVIATITDLRWGKIFNATTFPFLLLGLICQTVQGGLPSLTAAIIAVGVAMLLFFPLYILKTLAAADVKLLMALGAWTDSAMVIKLAVFSILFGAAVGLIVLVRQAGVVGGAKSVRDHARNAVAPGKSHRMPFAPAFLCAFLFLKIAESYHWSIL